MRENGDSSKVLNVSIFHFSKFVQWYLGTVFPCISVRVRMCTCLHVCVKENNKKYIKYIPSEGIDLVFINTISK